MAQRRGVERPERAALEQQAPRGVGAPGERRALHQRRQLQLGVRRPIEPCALERVAPRRDGEAQRLAPMRGEGGTKLAKQSGGRRRLPSRVCQVAPGPSHAASPLSLASRHLRTENQASLPSGTRALQARS